VGTPVELDPAESWDVVLTRRGFATCVNQDQARGLLARMVAKATHAVALLQIDETGDADGLALGRAWELRMLAENGVTAVQFEGTAAGCFSVFARV
jgi:hypothetical protein